MRMLDPAVPLGSLRPEIDGLAALEARLRLVLETRPGRLPWRPDFGCDLEFLVGEPASPQNLARAEFHVQQAISRWLPEVTAQRLTVSAQPIPNAPSGAGPAAPPGEGALVSLGTQAVLVVSFEVSTNWGPQILSTSIAP